MNNKRPSFHLYSFGTVLGTLDKRPNRITEDVPIALTIWETPRVLEAAFRKGDKDKILISYYKSQNHTVWLQKGKLHARACVLLSET